ncbi:hypothetical protein N7456_002575 [Penicillium angulare]|uniref:RNase H type-1 domain-containing protein n=1 Tax=Penicillium angulare TaxID=116970 RepID=A0A9W9G8G7_9EURO|nr:hypothetical protein N7456_002575 [Penicillium angulare]
MPLPVYQLPPAYKSISVTYHAAPPNRATFPVVCNGDTTTNVIPVLSNPDRAPSPEGRSVDYTICRRIPLQRDPEKPNLDQGVSAKLPRMAHQLPENPEFDFSASFNLAEELELLQEEEELERLQEESKGSNVVNDLIGDDSESDLSKSNLLPTAPTTPTSTCPTSISTSIASTTLTSTTSISLPSPAFPNFPTLPVPSNLQIDEPTPEVLFKVRARSSALDFAKDMVDVPNIWGFLHCHIVWTDGSLPRNGMGGSAIVWKVGLGERWRSLRRKLTFQTDRSEFAELHGLGMAVEKAINLVKEARDTRQAPLIDQVVILTDCTSCMYMVRDHYLDRYGPPQIFNSTLRLITGALRLLKRMGVVVEFHWVPGHSGVLGNDLADSEARSAARMEMKSHQAGNEAPHPDVERFVPV